ncbi:MAG: hypothetical protein AAGN35_09530 [Bacteroidota bacterium]
MNGADPKGARGAVVPLPRKITLDDPPADPHQRILPAWQRLAPPKAWSPAFPILWGLLLAVLPLLGWSQDAGEKKFQVNGYVKFLQSNSFAPVVGLDTTVSFTDNLIHNRLNLHYYPGERWKIAVESRNRLFWGDQVRQPGYGDLIDQYNGLVDLSVRWVDQGGFLLHSIIDRAYVNYSHKQWDVTVGRQRINWGVNLIWNPNDIFNAYNFLDFDYEERPGRDAIRVQYFPGTVSRAEVAFAPADTLENSVAAALYRFGLKGYDVQVMAGYAEGDAVFGGGWEGNLGQIGFKGEGSYFWATEVSDDPRDAFGASVTLDYLFGNGLYLTGSALYNSLGGDANTGGAQGGLVGGQLSARNIFPTEWAFYASAAGSPHPLVSLNAGVIYGTTNDLLIAVPSVTYSIKENWDIDLIGQLFFADPGTGFSSAGAGLFWRLKWSY